MAESVSLYILITGQGTGPEKGFTLQEKIQLKCTAFMKPEFSGSNLDPF
jgi:hypothetical protein